MQTTEMESVVATPNGRFLESKPTFDGRSALDYDDGVRRRIPGYEALHATTRAVLASRLPVQAKVLVVGAGTGQELVGCAQEHSGWTFVGVDPSKDMLEIANRKVLSADIANRVSFQVGTTSDLAPQLRFDAATALLVMHFLPTKGEKLAFLESIASRLDRGGVLVLAAATGQPGTPDFEDLFAAWKCHWCKTHGVSEEDQSVKDHFAERRERPGWLDERGHLELFARAGFVDPVRIWSGLVFNAWAMRKG